jgi:hypothetical protein
MKTAVSARGGASRDYLFKLRAFEDAVSMSILASDLMHLTRAAAQTSMTRGGLNDVAWKS